MRASKAERTSHLTLVGAALGLLLVVAPKPAQAGVAHPPVLTIVAGTGLAGSQLGPSGVATGTALASPVAIGWPSGELTIADTDNCRVVHVSIAGLARVVAGTGTCGASGDGGPARSAALDHPSGLARTPDGAVLVADRDSCTIRRIGIDGTITRIAGKDPSPMPSCGAAGDGGPALEAQLDHPADVAVAPDGSIVIADTGNCRIRLIDLAGTITTWAGSASCGSGGDGSQASRAQLDHPTGVAVDTIGRLLIADTGNHRVRRVGTGGAITTVAGTGTPGGGGDGGTATLAQLAEPTGLAVDAGGRIYVADRGNCRVRAITGTTIGTVAGSTCGTGTAPVNPAAAQLGAVGAVDVTAGGDLIVSDTGNHRIASVGRIATRDRQLASVFTPLDAAFDAYGNANTSPRNWSGGDATYSLRLPDGRVAWFFADSFTGTATPGDPGFVAPDHSRTGQSLIGNQLVIEDPRTTPPTFTNVWRPGAEGLDYIAPVDEFHRWWPFMPFLKSSSVVTLPVVSFDMRTGLVDAMATVDIPIATLQPAAPRIVAGGLIPNPRVALGCNALIDFGDTVLVNPDGSGYTYVYGTEVCSSTNQLFLHLARVPGRALHRLPWEYFAGVDPGAGTVTWSADPTASSRLRRISGAEIGDGGYEYSVARSAAGGYRMVHHLQRFGGAIVAATAPAPWGPFGDPVTIYRPPENQAPTHANLFADCGLTTYGAKEHMAFGNDTELVLSYNVNVSALTPGGCTGWAPVFEWGHNVDNYRPRFVRVPLVGGAPVPAPPG